MTPSRIFVIGASAGGHKAIVETLKGVSPDIDAAFLIVIHGAFDSLNNFHKYLSKRIQLKVLNASQRQEIHAGHVYVNIANRHLFVDHSMILLSNGPRENLFRPSVDVLFRSAAVSWKNRCVGILLTGNLNDGTAGLNAIKRCGGLVIIQNPQTAEFSEMPFSAHEEVEIDYILNLDKMAAIIEEICSNELPPEKEVPQSLIREAGIAMKIKSQIKTEDALGEQVPLSCSSCGGPLWKMDENGIERYRCHVGHSFSQEALLYSQDSKLEETLWVSLRTFEEKKILLKRMADDYSAKGFKSMALSYLDKIDEVTDHINRLRSLMHIQDAS